MSDKTPCCCCGLTLGVEQGPCGHPFCEVCIGRGHDEDCIVCHPEHHAVPDRSPP